MKKYCKICLKEIDQRGNYVSVRDFKDGVLYIEGFYHNPCFNDAIRRQVSQSTMVMLGRVNSLLNKAEDIINKNE